MQKIRDAIEAELKRDPAEYFDVAMKIVDWAAEMVARSDYDRNVKVAVASPYVVDKTFGIVISAAAAYDRQIAREVEAAAKRKAEAAATVDAWFGQVGQRVVADLVFVRAIGLPDNGFGPSVLHVFRGPAGEPIKWITGRGLRLDAGAVIRAKFTVKEHKIYNEVRETKIARLVEMEKAA